MFQGEINIDVLVKNLGREEQFKNRIEWALKLAEKGVLEGFLEKYHESARTEFFDAMYRWMENEREAHGFPVRAEMERCAIAGYAREYIDDLFNVRIEELKSVYPEQFQRWTRKNLLTVQI